MIMVRSSRTQCDVSEHTFAMEQSDQGVNISAISDANSFMVRTFETHIQSYFEMEHTPLTVIIEVRSGPPNLLLSCSQNRLL